MPNPAATDGVTGSCSGECCRLYREAIRRRPAFGRRPCNLGLQRRPGPNRAQRDRLARLPLRPASRFCAVVPPCEGLFRRVPEPDARPPRFDDPGELAMRAARALDMPFFLRPSYCFSFFTLLPGILLLPR